MRKIAIIFLLILPLFSNAQLFEGGIDFGLTASQIDGDGQGGYHKLGPAFCVYASLKVKKNWDIYSGVGYVFKGAGTGSKYEYFSTNLNYAEIPLVADYTPFNNISFSAGLIYAYLFKGIQKTTFTIFDEKDLNLLKNELSYLLSVNYKLSKNFTLRLSSNYSIVPITIYQGNFLVSNVIAYYLFYHVASSQLWWNNSLRLTLRYKIFSSNKK